MTIKQVLKELNFKGHVIIHVWQDAYWCPMGGGDVDKVIRRYGFYEPVESRIVDNVLIIRAVFKGNV